MSYSSVLRDGGGSPVGEASCADSYRDKLFLPFGNTTAELLQWKAIQHLLHKLDPRLYKLPLVLKSNRPPSYGEDEEEGGSGAGPKAPPWETGMEDGGWQPPFGPTTIDDERIRALDERAIRTYVTSYANHIQIRYPLVPGSKLYPQVADFAKRKTSTMTSAVVLMVLALGRLVDEAKRPIDTRTGDPGILYYAVALGIFRNQHAGGTPLDRILFHILSGLYLGRLGRVVESYREILVALRAILDERAAKRQRPGSGDTEDDPMLFYFWTCVQLASSVSLEHALFPDTLQANLSVASDIVANIPVNYSQLSILQGCDVPHPESEAAMKAFHRHLNPSWLDNTHIYVLQNQTCWTLYKNPMSRSRIESVQSHLEQFRHENPYLQDPDIESYWRIHVMLYRPYLRMTLDFVYMESQNSLSTEDIEFAEKGLEALMRFLEASHNVGPAGTTQPSVAAHW